MRLISTLVSNSETCQQTTRRHMNNFVICVLCVPCIFAFSVRSDDTIYATCNQSKVDICTYTPVRQTRRTVDRGGLGSHRRSKKRCKYMQDESAQRQHFRVVPLAGLSDRLDARCWLWLSKAGRVQYQGSLLFHAAVWSLIHRDCRHGLFVCSLPRVSRLCITNMEFFTL
jgi:hypothetical protein